MCCIKILNNKILGRSGCMANLVKLMNSLSAVSSIFTSGVKGASVPMDDWLSSIDEMKRSVFGKLWKTQRSACM